MPIYSLLAMNSLKNASRMTVQELSNSLKISEGRILTTLEALVLTGIIEAGCSGRGRYYVLSSEYYKRSNNTRFSHWIQSPILQKNAKLLLYHIL